MGFFRFMIELYHIESEIRSKKPTILGEPFGRADNKVE